MSSTINILRSAYEKASADRTFLAFLLKKYQEAETMSEASMTELLGCQLESYYKLGLCVAPDTASANYLVELNKICDYIGVPILPLNKIIKRAATLFKFSDDGVNSPSVLMAARDKNKEK